MQYSRNVFWMDFVPLGFDVICLDYRQTIQHETNLLDHHMSGIQRGSVRAASNHNIIT
jgi:hypothetical protein